MRQQGAARQQEAASWRMQIFQYRITILRYLLKKIYISIARRLPDGRSRRVFYVGKPCKRLRKRCQLERLLSKLSRRHDGSGAAGCSRSNAAAAATATAG